MGICAGIAHGRQAGLPKEEYNNMHCVKQITQDMYWVGGSDRRLALFENVYPIPSGVSYNAYLVLDEQTALFDTVDKAVSEVADELESERVHYLKFTRAGQATPGHPRIYEQYEMAEELTAYIVNNILK